MKHILTATALSTLLLIGCSQESSDSTQSDSLTNTNVSKEIESIKKDVTEAIDPSSLPHEQTGAVNLVLKDGSVDVVGQAMLQPTGIRTVEVLLNGEPAGIATYKIERKLHKTYDDFYDPNKPNVGFEYTINTTKLAAGEYKVTIKATGVNGNTFTFGNNKVFTVE